MSIDYGVIIVRESKYRYVVQSLGKLEEIIKTFFGSLPNGEIVPEVEESMIKKVFGYAIAKYVYSKEVEYSSVWNNIEVKVPNEIIRQILPTSDVTFSMSISQTTTVDPLTKESVTRNIYSVYEY